MIDLAEKLDPIPVYVIADEVGAPLVASGENDTKVSGIFISQEDADNFINDLRINNPEIANKVTVVPISLGEVYRLSVSEQIVDNDLNFAYVPEAEAIEDAASILNNNGQEYEGGVPLFVARELDQGYLTIERDSVAIIPFFFDLQQLEELLIRFAQNKPEVADNIIIEFVPLEGLIETFETSNNEILNKIVLVPTSESLEFLVSVNAEADFAFISETQNVYRFFNRETGVHFYTASEIEKNSVIENLPNYTLEGAAYKTIDPLTGMDNADVVHRFLNQSTGVHLYTVDEVERSYIADNLSNYEYEGSAFLGYTSQVENTIPIHRFYNSTIDAHFYTASEIEKNVVENDLSNYDYEGIAYYAYSVDV